MLKEYSETEEITNEDLIRLSDILKSISSLVDLGLLYLVSETLRNTYTDSRIESNKLFINNYLASVYEAAMFQHTCKLTGAIHNDDLASAEFRSLVFGTRSTLIQDADVVENTRKLIINLQQSIDQHKEGN